MAVDVANRIMYRSQIEDFLQTAKIVIQRNKRLKRKEEHQLLLHCISFCLRDMSQITLYDLRNSFFSIPW